MESLSRNSRHRFGWQYYKQLELIPDSVPDSQANQPIFRFGLESAWRGLITLLLDELMLDQQVDYLERCWQVNELGQRAGVPANRFQQLWVLMS